MIVENCVRRLAHAQAQYGRPLTRSERFHEVFLASKESRRPLLFGQLIIMVVYQPIFALTGVEGKMFHPMAFTVVAALVGMLAMSGPVWNDLTDLVWLLATLTMLAGAFGALGQSNLKRLLAYSSVTHMGTLLVGVLCQTSEGFAATTFYVVVYVVTSLGAFAVIASLADSRGEPMTFDQWRGLGYRHPVRCGVLVLLLLSLAGLPATAGFMAKFAVFHAALQSGYIGLLMIGILASVISFAFYLRVTMLLFQPDEQASSWHQGSVFEHTVLAVCSSAVLVLGLFPGLLFDLIRQILP